MHTPPMNSRKLTVNIVSDPFWFFQSSHFSNCVCIMAEEKKILAELQDIKALLTELVTPKPRHPKEKLIEMIQTKNADVALNFLAPYDPAYTRNWGFLPADLALNDAAVFFRCLRLGLIDLETTSLDNLQRIFDSAVTAEDRKWFLSSQALITPNVAVRMRMLQRPKNDVLVNIVKWLCVRPACLERIQFAWALKDTTGAPVYCQWNTFDCMVKGDLFNADFVKWWAENVLVAPDRDV